MSNPALPKAGPLRQALVTVGESVDAPGSPPAPPSNADEWFVLTMMFRQWKVIVGAAILTAVVAFLVTMWIPETYEASATMIVTSADATAAAQVAAITNARTLLESRTAAAAVVSRLHLDASPYRLSAATFVERLTVGQIRDTNYLRVSLRLPSADLAANALNAYLEDSIELNRKLSIENATTVAQGLMKTQLDQARAAVNERTQQLQAARVASKVDILRKDVDHLAELRAFTRELDGAIRAEEGRIATAERELASRPRLLTTPRSASDGSLLDYTRRLTDEGAARRVPSTPAVTSPRPAAPGQAPLQPGNTSAKPSSAQEPSAPPRTITEGSFASNSLDPPLPLNLQNPYVDPVYEILEYQVAMGRTRLAGLQSQRAELAKTTTDPASELYAGEARVRRLELDYEIAMQVYKDLALRFEQAREYAVSHAAIIQVVDTATPPLSPIAPNRPLVVASAAVIGLMIGFLLALIRQLQLGQPHAPRVRG